MLFTVSIFAFLAFFVSVAGVVYPFKPFRKRSRALLSILASFVVFMYTAFMGAVGSMTPSETATDAVAAPVQATATQVVPKSTQPQEGSSGPSSSANRSTADPETPQKPDKSELDDLRKTFESLNWKQTKFRFKRFHNLGYDIEDIAAEYEDRTLAIVRPLPVSDHEMNLRGYELLAAIRPENQTYKAKVADYEARIEAEKRAAVSRLRKNEDRVEGIIWYQHPNAPRYLNSRSTAYLYIGRRGETGRPWLRMKVQYTASDWLFVNKVTAWHDGIKEPLIDGRFERDNNSTIWEWMDVSPDDYQIEVLRSLANADEAILRFQGTQYRRDIKLSAKDKKAIREILAAFDAMKNVAWN